MVRDCLVPPGTAAGVALRGDHVPEQSAGFRLVWDVLGDIELLPGRRVYRGQQGPRPRAKDAK